MKAEWKNFIKACVLVCVCVCGCVDTDLAVHSVELVVKGHGEVGWSAGSYMGDERGLALADCVVHVHTTLTDLHVLEAGFDTAKEGKWH